MASDKQPSTIESPTPITAPSQTNTTSGYEPPLKRLATRSNEQSAADYLLDQRRIDLYNTNPRRKHLFISINAQSLFNALKAIYLHFFRVHWTYFGKAMEQFKNKGNSESTYDYAASVYVSHFLLDTYYTIRKSIKVIDPTAYLEKYEKSTALFCTVYDHFLSTLNAHLRPTHVIGISDAVYIPVLSKDMFKDIKNPLPDITGIIQDYDCFQLLHQTLEGRKVCKLTELSSDAMGRPSWLFDVYDDGSAFSWFQQEGNFNDVDTTVAYIVGAAITPKLAMYDGDAWVNYPRKTTKAEALAAHKRRVTRRQFTALAESRNLEIQHIHLPDFYETDTTKAEALNKGPLRLLTTSATSTSTPQEEEDDVPASPRTVTATDPDKNKVFRIRVMDRLYFAQVILKTEESTRLAAHKIFVKY